MSTVAVNVTPDRRLKHRSPRNLGYADSLSKPVNGVSLLSTPLPFPFVSMAKPEPTLTLINLPGRHPILPKLYYADHHPLVPAGKHCIVLLHDTSVAHMAEMHKWEKSQKIPNATDEELKARGSLEVPEDMLIFARDIGSTDPTQDALQAWLTPASMMSDDVKAALRDATDVAMGPDDSITLEPPELGADGVWKGGLAIERDSDPVKTGTRCYTIANSHQSPKGIWSPAQGSKVNGSFDESNLMRRNLNIAVAPFPMAAMQQVPEHMRADIYDYTSMLNIPALGVPGNTAHNTLQMNVAPAISHGSATTLDSALGFYGGNHNNKKDSAGRFTNMTMCSRLPDSYSLSKFHIFGLGIYFTLHNFDSANFCGLYHHGGTPPIAPSGVEVAKDAYRITFISYPPEKMGDGLGHVVVGAMPTANDKVLKMSAEMQHIDCESRIHRASVNRANFAADGQVVMDVRAHVVFMARMFLLLLIFLSNQLPLAYDFRIDSDRLLRYRAPPSDLDEEPDAESEPDVFSHNGSSLLPQETLRAQIKQRWHLHYNRHAAHIPYAVVNAKLYEVDVTGALLHPGPLVSDRVDALGNPIEAGGRPYRKPIGPISEATALKRARAAELTQARKAAKEAAKLANNDSDADETPARKKRKRSAKSAAPAASQGLSSSSSGESSETRERPLRSYRSKFANAGTDGLWTSPAFAAMQETWTVEQDKRHRSGRSGTMALARSRGVEMEMEEASANIEDITMRDPVEELLIETFGEAGIRLVDRLSLHAIAQDHSSVQSAYQLVQTAEPVMTTWSRLDAAFNEMQTDPDSVETSLTISRIWAQFEHLGENEARAALALKLQRQGVMMATFCVWSWLDSYCVKEITEALDDNSLSGAGSWIRQLARHVSMLMETRASSRELRSSQFGLDVLDTVYQYRQRVTLDVELPLAQVITIVLEVIAAWLGFPIKSKSRARAWFVDTMVHGCTPATLLLDSVWFAFCHLETEALGDRSTKISSPAAFAPLAEALRSSALASPSSQEFLLLSDMQKMLHEYRTGVISTIRSPPRLLLTTPDSRENRLMNILLDSLLELEPLIDGYSNLPHPTLFQATVQGKMDYLLPFREHGPSRVQSRLPGNAFDPTTARTLGGLFSGLIFRAVIFATPFSMQARTYFDDPLDWDSECAKFPSEPSTFFCNLTAYSKRKSNRGVHLVNVYWATLQDKSCRDWEDNTRNGDYDFTACFKFLKASKPMRFREIGALIGFLLTADFVYAGAVKAPSVDTVASLIREINAGGMKGLELLELIPAREKGAGSSYKKGDDAQVKAGFSRLHRFLDTKLSAVQKAHMGFDVIMEENTLCKLTRWIKMKLVKVDLD
ncbi:hypothetical protein C8R47DRAFT_1226657 [Mycena vitilis]|nr:hypothetical protein C8R47DRAFT_1226657 [Mycena vitilis]